MKKRSIISLVAAAALTAGAMVSTPVFAGQINAGNTSIAQEIIPSSKSYPDNATVVFEPGVPVAAGGTIKFTLNGATFDNSSDNVTLYGNSGLVGTGKVDNTTGSSVNITLKDSISSGDVLTLANRSDNSSLIIDIPAGTKAGTTVTISSSSTDAPGVAATATVATIAQEFTASITPVTSKIDFGTAMKNFVKTNDTSTAKLLISNDNNIAKKVYTNTNVCDDNVTTADNVSIAAIKITGKLASVTSAQYNGNPSYTLTSADKTNGYFTLPTNSLANALICKKSSSSATEADLSLTVDGKTVISPDTKTAEVTLKVPSGLETVIPAGTKAFVWQLNATQFYVPLLGYDANSGRQTYIKLQANNNVSNSIDVSAQVLTEDGKMTDVGVVGSITPGTPLVITAQELMNKVEAAGKKVDGLNGFAVVLTVKAPRKDVFGYANIIDPSGAKRVPLQCVYDNGQIVE